MQGLLLRRQNKTKKHAQPNKRVFAYTFQLQSARQHWCIWPGYIVCSLLASHAWAADDAVKDDAWYNQQVQELPLEASRYNASKGVLLAAESTDTAPQGTSALPISGMANKPTNAIPNVELKLNTINVTAKRFKDIGPLPGLNLTKEQIPGNVQSVTAEEIKANNSLSITDLLNSKLQSVNVNDYQGNPFQMDLTYRGFTAGPQIGSQQGLSVFFDGIRVNEPFGDVVNWDMIPMNAIAGLDVFPGSNPLFGLNTLGGAISIKTKSGFDSPGISAQILKGSYGREQLQASAGWNNGSSVAAFAAVNLFMEDGWRDNSPSKVNQAFGKIEWQGERASLAFSTLAVVNKLVGNGTVPTELYKQDPTAVFTSPDVTRNRLLQMQISGAFEINDTMNLTGMVYDRSSKRTSNTGDIIDIDTFRDLGYATRRANAGENISCVFQDADGDGFPNYYLDRLTQNADGTYTSAFIEDAMANIGDIANGTYSPNYSLLTSYNTGLSQSYIDYAKQIITSRSDGGTLVTDADGQQMLFRGGDGSDAFFGEEAQQVLISTLGGGASYFTRLEGGQLVRYNIIPAPAINQDCYSKYMAGDRTKLYTLNADGSVNYINRDGARQGAGTATAGQGTGYVQGTPTAVITNSLIDQTGQGFSGQFNWNLDTHKFMVGISLDKAGAKYNASQRFGLLDSQRNVYSDPDNIGEEYYAGGHDVLVNSFDGDKTTKSIYFSETWSPTQTLNFAFSGRYNATHVRNTLAPKAKYSELTDAMLLNHFMPYVICSGTGTSNCDYDPSSMVPADEYAALTGGRFANLGDPVTEKFNYYSFNPAIGATWQATPRLNMYFNWNQGTRTPSVIELGCAYDGTIVPLTDLNGNPVGNITGPRSIVDGRSCSLPSVLSGDPYLPQVKAQTYEVGVRGKFKDLLDWNVTAYRTMLRDDLYMVAANSQLSFFQSIGDTRRQGIEFGLQGAYGRHEFRANYSLTEATFQSLFNMLSANNSAILGRNTSNLGTYNMIAVEPGDRMPGVPLNNFNFSWMYKLTPELKVGLTMVAHSDAFVRGNENNEHTPGSNPGIYKSVYNEELNATVKTWVPAPDYTTSGKTPGYAVFNLRANYDLGKGWSAGLLINNLLDKTYFSAGRLGLTPFTPSTYGAIGAGGFNYNSSEWLSTQFISAGAPRGIWLSLSYDFDASKKFEPPKSSSDIMTDPDRTLAPVQRPLTAEEQALLQTLDTTSPVPVLKQDIAKSAAELKAAKQSVNSTVKEWADAWNKGDADAYFRHYSAQFKPVGMTPEAWREQRKLQLIAGTDSKIVLQRIVVAPQGRGMSVIVTQSQGKAQTRKALGLEQQGGQWQIVRELDLAPPAKAIPTAEQTEMPARPPVRILSMKEAH
ncbi:TonB-dependent receptor domain-containing protein [Methylovorus mays]|uniref:TonB-dependent receptor domain-containing protein n=1 Tax=Methylovorus mays TaxID=184077 RepID=UPI001E292832|nr:TonB-dependent receptor [Methylovorus mays]MCB5207397.1 TonB-dependent receptor [Methylovorus mays]